MNIFHYNPTCEMAIANGSPFYMAPALLRQFEQDLAPLMAFFADENDWVVCEQKTEPAYLEQLRILGVKSVNFIGIEDLAKWKLDHPTELVQLKPWGKSPAEAYRFSFLSQDEQIWQSAYSALFERKTSARFLQSFLKQNQQLSIVDPKISIQIITSVAEVDDLIQNLNPLVLKAPLSSSGRGLLVLRRNCLNEANRQLIDSVVKQQGYMTAEKWYQKIGDLSFQFEVEPSQKVNYRGTSYFFTNSNGQYGGHYLGKSSILQTEFSPKKLNEVAERLCEALAKSIFAELHAGPIGIDAILFRGNNHEVNLHPCLEINPRYTMGYLALQLQSKIHPEANGEFRVQYFGSGELARFVEEETKKNPPIVVDGLVRKGFFALNPVGRQSRFCAFLRLF